MGHKRFRIRADESPYYPAGSPYFFWAMVFDTKQDMYDWWLKYPGRQGNKCNFEAKCMPSESINVESGSLADNIGTVIFHKGALSAGLVAHEMAHCAFWYERLINGNKWAVFGAENGEREERLLYILHDFIEMFYQKWHLNPK